MTHISCLSEPTKQKLGRIVQRTLGFGLKDVLRRSLPKSHRRIRSYWKKVSICIQFQVPDRLCLSLCFMGLFPSCKKILIVHHCWVWFCIFGYAPEMDRTINTSTEEHWAYVRVGRRQIFFLHLVILENSNWNDWACVTSESKEWLEVLKCVAWLILVLNMAQIPKFYRAVLWCTD